MSELRRENEHLKQLVAEISLHNRALKKKSEWFGVKFPRYLRYGQAQKMEIIKLVENSNLSVKVTLRELGINRSTFYYWYRRYLEQGYDGLAGSYRKPRQFWNQIPETERERVVETALEKPELSPRELACYITDNCGYFISESSVYGS